MRDILEIINEADRKGKDGKEKNELAAEYLLRELSELKGTDISKYISCTLDAIEKQYVITLKIPITAAIFKRD